MNISPALQVQFGNVGLLKFGAEYDADLRKMMLPKNDEYFTGGTCH